MYIERVRYKRGEKTYEQILLRESYRQPGAKRSAVKKRTLLNLTKYSPKLIRAIELALKHKEDLSALTSLKEVNMQQSQSVGGVFTLLQVARRSRNPRVQRRLLRGPVIREPGLADRKPAGHRKPAV
ncbi:MAG TPA: hypothetical protein ENF48_06145 [Desulfobacteraceae bacterium]|nr:hypothetical protein [Deltaproteobacteria bacterium]MBW2355933.1 hypothetical protein [Deltaproteobacteria bacterium]HDI59915.1 hypothetical protein [Desulfobacteraceae bacterium]